MLLIQQLFSSLVCQKPRTLFGYQKRVLKINPLKWLPIVDAFSINRDCPHLFREVFGGDFDKGGSV